MNVTNTLDKLNTNFLKNFKSKIGENGAKYLVD